MAEKSQAFTLIDKVDSVFAFAQDIEVSKETSY